MTSVPNAAKNVRIVQMMNCAVNAAFALTVWAVRVTTVPIAVSAKIVWMRSAIAVTDARNVRLSAKNAVNSVKTALMAVFVKIAASVLTVSAGMAIIV